VIKTEIYQCREARTSASFFHWEGRSCDLELFGPGCVLASLLRTAATFRSHAGEPLLLLALLSPLLLLPSPATFEMIAEAAVGRAYEGSGLASDGGPSVHDPGIKVAPPLSCSTPRDRLVGKHSRRVSSRCCCCCCSRGCCKGLPYEVFPRGK
jgi:hypothetical protein